MPVLPIGVIVPTKNSAALLPKHLEAMQNWLDLVEEVVVVDSFSTDRTMALIRSGLRHSNLKLLAHPPGLYQCWNHALSQLTTKYSYIATVGDCITREGLQRLHAAAESLACEVVISKPWFFTPAEEPVPDIHWPIDDVIKTLRLAKPRKLEKLEALIFALANISSALTGSCASDLFRTRVLQRHPFPTEFGTTGDGAWSLLHVLDVSWGVVPDRFSRFLVHPTNASEAERRSYEHSERLDLVARRGLRLACEAGVVSKEELDRGCIEPLLNAVSGYLDDKQEFDGRRRGKLPWVIVPAAWKVRRRRNRSRARLQEAKERALAAVAKMRPQETESAPTAPCAKTP